MNDRTRTVLRALAGSYLAYVGFGLVKMMLKDQPDNMMIFVSVGLAFLAIGVALLGYSVSHYIKKDYIHQTNEREKDSEQADTGKTEENLEQFDDKDSVEGFGQIENSGEEEQGS